MSSPTQNKIITDSSKALLAQLKNPFDPKFVKWRVGATNKDKTKGIALAYIDSREVTKRLDEICGIGNWQKKLTAVEGGFSCEIQIRVDGEWISRENAAGNTKVEAVKGAASDAFKRAASDWGVGRYLYYLPNVWVPIVPQGNSYALAEIPELPEWAKPGKVENWEDVAEMEADANSGEDDQDTLIGTISNYERIINADSADKLELIVDSLSTEEQIAFATQIDAKTKELLDGNRKTEPANR